MASSTLKAEIMNGPAPTGLRLNSHVLGFLVPSHFFSAVGEGTMPGSDAKAYGNDVHGSLSVTFTVNGSTACTSPTNAMKIAEDRVLRGHAMYSAHVESGNELPTR